MAMRRSITILGLSVASSTICREALTLASLIDECESS